jgi:type 2 lantibiotic biosynthesis protein LanM
VQTIGPDELAVRGATIDELLSDRYVTARTGIDTGRSHDRMRAWAVACAADDQAGFVRRLARDGWSLDEGTARLADARPTSRPEWVEDASWVEAALTKTSAVRRGERSGLPFEEAFRALVDEADRRLESATAAADRLAAGTRVSLRRNLLRDLCTLCAPSLYERFEPMRDYRRFIDELRTCLFTELFTTKPVLLRLMTTLTRQWLDASHEFLTRLGTDFPDATVSLLEAGLSDRHNGGRQAMLVGFDTGVAMVYKPRDPRPDVAWYTLIERLNRSAPIRLRTARVIPCSGYGWSEHIAHTGCSDARQLELYFRRAGAWLALFHCFTAGDMHQENIIAAADHPVPVDLETLLQGGVGVAPDDDDAVGAARVVVADSVLATGLLPSYGSAPGSRSRLLGGLAPGHVVTKTVEWRSVNTDAMHPVPGQSRARQRNLPHIDGAYAGPDAYVEHFIGGYTTYATYLSKLRGDELFDGFAGLPTRRVLRPTQFYSMLLQRIRDDRTMDDGVVWSAQADFVARLADWAADDPDWGLHRLEREALLRLDVPHFTVDNSAGLARAGDRLAHLDRDEITWQVEVIRQAWAAAVQSSSSEHTDSWVHLDAEPAPAPEDFGEEADAAARRIAGNAVRRGAGAAWIGLGSLATSDACRLEVLGPDLYGGSCGVALFLAAHARVRRSDRSAALALAAVSPLRARLASPNSGHLARVLGVGGATGLGSIVYTFAVMAELLDEPALLDDARAASVLVTDDMITADQQLDVVGGCAGAILALLRLHRDTGWRDAVDKAVRCGEQLLATERIGTVNGRTWRGAQDNLPASTGISHGAAGFGYALSALAAVTGEAAFAAAAMESVAFHREHLDEDPRSQWCHGAAGIGLARLAMVRFGQVPAATVADDVDHALRDTARHWPCHVDTLCCGSLGTVELYAEAGKILHRPPLAEDGARRLGAVLRTKKAAGDFRWNHGTGRFNLGMFRGLAGGGYTCLRRLDGSLPNILIWE